MLIKADGIAAKIEDRKVLVWDGDGDGVWVGIDIPRIVSIGAKWIDKPSDTLAQLEAGIGRLEALRRELIFMDASAMAIHEVERWMKKGGSLLETFRPPDTAVK